MHHRAKFWANRSRRRRDMAVFDFSRWLPSAILDFQKLEMLTAYTPLRAKMCHLAKSVKPWWIIWPFSYFQDGGLPPSWICYRLVGTTLEVYFGGLCHCAKFGLNRCSSFDNMQVLIF